MPPVDVGRRHSVGTRIFIVGILLWTIGWPMHSIASVVRVEALGGESSLLLDKSNLFRYPSLARVLAHADIELFSEWAGAVIPMGASNAVGLFVNRGSTALDRLNDYVPTTGSDNFRALAVRPLFEVMGATRLGNLHLGTAVSVAYDRQQSGQSEAWARLSRALLGMSVGAGSSRGLDLSIRLGSTGFTDRDAGQKASQTDGTMLGVDVRGRWHLGGQTHALPWAVWERDEAGLSPESRRVTTSRLGVGINMRPRPSTLLVLGLLAGLDEEEVMGTQDPILKRRTVQLPTTLAGTEIRTGAVSIRLGIRHSARWQSRTVAGIEEESFSTHLRTHIGLGFQLDRVSIDGLLRKQILLDGPYLLTGAGEDDGGLFTNLSLTYRFFE